MPPNPPQSPERRKSRSAIAALVLTELLALYLLSLGPAEAAFYRGYISETVLYRAYWPIWWLRSKWDPLDETIVWYGHLCSDVVIYFPDPSAPEFLEGSYLDDPRDGRGVR